MDRKIVKPAQEGGKIWNPEHGRFLPAEGLEVEMTPYWLGLVSREDITATDLPPEPAAKVETKTDAGPDLATKAPAPTAAPPAAAKAPVKAAPAA